MPEALLSRRELQHEMTQNGLTPIYCSTCGRFLGYERITDGLTYLFCKNQHWSVVIRGDTELLLTGQEIYDRLIERSRGQEG